MKFFSKNPRKQRNFARNLGLHLRKKLCNCHLSKELRKEIGKRTVGAKKGDKVRIMRGKHAGKEGKLTRIDRNKGNVFVEKIVRKKADGTEILLPIKASNVLIIELERSDERRFGETKKPEKLAKKKEETDIWAEETKKKVEKVK